MSAILPIATEYVAAPRMTRCANRVRELERIEIVGARTTYSLLGNLSVRCFAVVPHCEPLLMTTVCTDENLVLQIRSAVGDFNLLEP